MSTVVWVPSPPNDHTPGGRTSAPPPCARVLTAAPSPTPPPFHTKNPSRRSLSYPSRPWRRCPRRQTFTRPAAAPPHRHCARACHQPHLAQRRRRPHEEPQAATCRHDHLDHGVGALAAERPCARRPHSRTVAVRACPQPHYLAPRRCRSTSRRCNGRRRSFATAANGSCFGQLRILGTGSTAPTPPRSNREEVAAFVRATRPGVGGSGTWAGQVVCRPRLLLIGRWPGT